MAGCAHIATIGRSVASSLAPLAPERHAEDEPHAPRTRPRRASVTATYIMPDAGFCTRTAGRQAAQYPLRNLAALTDQAGRHRGRDTRRRDHRRPQPQCQGISGRYESFGVSDSYVQGARLSRDDAGERQARVCVRRGTATLLLYSKCKRHANRDSVESFDQSLG